MEDAGPLWCPSWDSQSCLTHLPSLGISQWELWGGIQGRDPGEGTNTLIFSLLTGKVPLSDLLSQQPPLPVAWTGWALKHGHQWMTVACPLVALMVSSVGTSLHARTPPCVVVVNNPQIVFDFCCVFLYFYSKLSASDFMGIHSSSN